MTSRSDLIAHYRKNPKVSVLILGGGVNGMGTFRDLALQGVDVLLAEAGDISIGASAASSHMVHGGIRYLENGEFRLVREAVHERELLLKNAPHAVKLLPTTIPMFKWFSGLFNAPLKFLRLLDKPSERGAVIIKFGLIMYDSYTGRNRRTKPHKFSMRKETLKQYPAIAPDILCTATYYDAYMPYPERISLELALDAEADHSEARAVNYLRAVGSNGNRVILRDEIGGGTVEVEPKVVINAGGPWIDLINTALGYPTRYMGGTKGSHLILENPALREMIGDHEFFFENKDGRIVLILPFFDQVMVGTSDIPIEDPDSAVCTPEETTYFLEMIHRVFPNIPVDRSQIVFTFSGVRPLPASDAKVAGQITRDHSIEVIEGKLPFPVYSMVGGKWTTFRAFAAQITERTLGLLGRKRLKDTVDLPIGGGKGYPISVEKRKEWLANLSKKTGLPVERLDTWLERYGTWTERLAEFSAAGKDAPLKHTPEYTRREIQYLCLHEKVERLDDLAIRRTSLGMQGKLTKALVEELAEISSEALGWNSSRRKEEITRLKELLRTRHVVELA